MEIVIRKSVPGDVFAIRNVQKLTWLATYPNKTEGITLKDIEEKFARDSTPEGIKKIEEKKKVYNNSDISTWVATDGDAVVGFCGAVKSESNNRIAAIYVLPEYQSRGSGKKLLLAALYWLGTDKPVLINTASYNQRAIKFYEKFGFKLSGKTPTSASVAPLPSGKIIPEVELVKYN